MKKAILSALAAFMIGNTTAYGQIGEPRNDLAIGICNIHTVLDCGIVLGGEAVSVSG